MRAFYDDLGAFAKWWWVSTGMWLMMSAFASKDRGDQPLPDFGLEWLAFSTVSTVVLVIPGVLAFSRQRRLVRFATKFGGAIGPLALLWASAELAPDSFVVSQPYWTIMAIALALVATWVEVGKRGLDQLRSALAGDGALHGWSPVAKADQYRLDPLLERGLDIAGMGTPKGSTRTGAFGDRRAVVFSGTAEITAIPETVDWQSRLALLINVFLTKGRQTDASDHADTTRVFTTTIAVELGAGGAIGAFDLRSRGWRDGDVVYTNVADRIERFESIDLDRTYRVRLPADTSQLDAWRAITPDVIAHVASVPGLDLSRRDGVLVASRIGGCGRPAELDELVAAVRWFAAGPLAAPNLHRTPEPTR